MSNVMLWCIAGTVLVGGAVGSVIYLKQNKIKSQIAATTEQIEGELQFEDVVAYFRSLNLNEEVDTPFLAIPYSTQFKGLTHGMLPPPKEGYKLLMLGVYNNDTDVINKYKFIYSLGWSEKLTEIMGDEPMVALS